VKVLNDLVGYDRTASVARMPHNIDFKYRRKHFNPNSLRVNLRLCRRTPKGLTFAAVEEVLKRCSNLKRSIFGAIVNCGDDV